MRRHPLLALLTALVLALPAVPAAAATPPRTYSGTIDGAAYLVTVPHRWNGTLVLFSHPYYTEEVPGGIGHAGREETAAWLLDNGYALAASEFTGRNGFVVKDALTDNVRLLDWFTTHVGRPRRTVATGASMGAAVSVLLAERHPRRVDGVLAMCGPLDLAGTWNVSLDVTFAIRALLAPGADIDLVRPRNAEAGVAALHSAVERAKGTPEGRARIALASAFGNVDGWNSAHEPRPAGVDEQVLAQVALDQMIFIGAFGPVGRVDLERRAGGNPSSNVGVDYRRQLARSTQRDLVVAAYRAAGLDLDADLAALANAPRVAADPRAAAWLHRHAVPGGTTPAPVVTMHNFADVADPAHERWYADRVARHGDPRELRQLFVGRATHCAFNAAEEITAMRVLFRKIEAGRWPHTSPAALNAAADRFGESYRKVFDLASYQDLPRPPAFTEFAPPLPLRPSR